MIWFKSCPRCERGDVIFEEESEGCRIKCAQCDYSLEVDSRYEATLVLQQGELLIRQLLELAAI